jgi:hypothetical protein
MPNTRTLNDGPATHSNESRVSVVDNRPKHSSTSIYVSAT